MRARLRRIKDHLWGPAGSVLLHLMLVLLLLSLFRIEGRQDVTEAPPITIGQEETLRLDPPPPEPKTPPPDRRLDEPRYTAPAVAPPEAPPPPEIIERPDPTATLATITSSTPTTLSLVSNPLDVRTGDKRTHLDDLHGGPWAGPADQAVNRALQWLCEQQQSDGSWQKHPVAMTGLALLTFLAHGETPSSEAYGETVQKAVTYLLETQRPDGSLGPVRSNSAATYAHAIGTYALAEAFTMTRIHAIKLALEPAVQVLLDGQQAGGGWDYQYAQGARRDTSVSGWHVQALKAAYLAGAENPGLAAAMNRAAADLRRVADPADGSFGYTRPGDGNWRMTGVGTLCLQLLAEADSPEVREGLRYLRALDCDWSRDGHLYGWYYVTQAKFHAGGPAWTAWNQRFAETLLGAQQEDGHWDYPQAANGRHEHGSDQGPVYSTTLAALTLQVYHRALPTYSAKAVDETSYEKRAREDDLLIESI